MRVAVNENSEKHTICAVMIYDTFEMTKHRNSTRRFSCAFPLLICDKARDTIMSKAACFLSK